MKTLNRKLQLSHAHVVELEATLEEKEQSVLELKKRFELSEKKFHEYMQTQADELDVAKAKASQLVKTQVCYQTRAALFGNPR